MNPSIKYSRIISDICPGMIVLIILLLLEKENVISLIRSFEQENVKLGFLSFGVFIFLSIFLGKLVNLFGYILLRIPIRCITYIFFKYKILTYYRKHWLYIKIVTFEDYIKLKCIKAIVNTLPNVTFDFDNGESVKRLLRTTTSMIFISSVTIILCYIEYIKGKYMLIVLSVMLLANILSLFTTCFVYVYLYYKYVECAILLTKIEFVSPERTRIICDKMLLNNIIDRLYQVLNTQAKSKNKNDEYSEIKIE